MPVTPIEMPVATLERVISPRIIHIPPEVVMDIGREELFAVRQTPEAGTSVRRGETVTVTLASANTILLRQIVPSWPASVPDVTLAALLALIDSAPELLNPKLSRTIKSAAIARVAGNRVPPATADAMLDAIAHLYPESVGAG